MGNLHDRKILKERKSKIDLPLVGFRDGHLRMLNPPGSYSNEF